MKTTDYLNLNEEKVSTIALHLNQLLADFHVHYMNLRGFHWNVTGHGFFVLHGKFEEMYDDAAEKIDEIAERILMLGGVPENKFSNLLKTAKIEEVSNVSCGIEMVEKILDAYKYFIGVERCIIDAANEANDVVTADMMTGYLKEQEKMVWMLSAFATKNCQK